MIILTNVGNIVFVLINNHTETFVFTIQAHWLFSFGEGNLFNFFTIYGQISHFVWCYKPICIYIIQALFFKSYLRLWFFYLIMFLTKLHLKYKFTWSWVSGHPWRLITGRHYSFKLLILHDKYLSLVFSCIGNMNFYKVFY